MFRWFQLRAHATAPGLSLSPVAGVAARLACVEAPALSGHRDPGGYGPVDLPRTSGGRTSSHVGLWGSKATEPSETCGGHTARRWGPGCNPGFRADTEPRGCAASRVPESPTWARTGRPGPAPAGDSEGAPGPAILPPDGPAPLRSRPSLGFAGKRVMETPSSARSWRRRWHRRAAGRGPALTGTYPAWEVHQHSDTRLFLSSMQHISTRRSCACRRSSSNEPEEFPRSHSTGPLPADCARGRTSGRNDKYRSHLSETSRPASSPLSSSAECRQGGPLPGARDRCGRRTCVCPACVRHRRDSVPACEL